MGRIKWQGVQFGSHCLSRKESRNGVDSILLAPASFSVFSEYVPLKFKLIDWWHLYTVESHPISLKHRCFSSLQQEHLHSLLRYLQRERAGLPWVVCVQPLCGSFHLPGSEEEFNKMLVCRFLRGCCVSGLNRHMEVRPAWSSVCLWHIALLVASLRQAFVCGSWCWGHRMTWYARTASLSEGVQLVCKFLFKMGIWSGFLHMCQLCA